MENFFGLAANVRGLAPCSVDNGEPLACGYVYSYRRSLIRTADPNILANALDTDDSFDGQAILRLGAEPTPFGSFLIDLKRRFGGRGFELRTVPNEPIDLAPFSSLGGLIIVRSTKACGHHWQINLGFSHRDFAANFDLV